MIGTLISMTKYNVTAFLGVNTKCGLVVVKALAFRLSRYCFLNTKIITFYNTKSTAPPKKKESNTLTKVTIALHSHLMPYGTLSNDSVMAFTNFIVMLMIFVMLGLC